jgi:hypothetical protein
MARFASTMAVTFDPRPMPAIRVSEYGILSICENKYETEVTRWAWRSSNQMATARRRRDQKGIRIRKYLS